MQYQYHTIIISLIKLKKRVGITDSHPLFIIFSYLAFAQSIYITETYPCSATTNSNMMNQLHYSNFRYTPIGSKAKNNISCPRQ